MLQRKLKVFAHRGRASVDGKGLWALDALKGSGFILLLASLAGMAVLAVGPDAGQAKGLKAGLRIVQPHRLW